MSVTAEILCPDLESGSAEDAPAQREKLLNSGRMHWVHWLVIALSGLLTVIAWYISAEQVHRAAEERFLREVDQVTAVVSERMRLYESALLGARSLIDSNGGKVDYPLWLRYANSLSIDEVYPGINGIGVIFNLQPGEVDAFVEAERDWRPDFGLHPAHGADEFWPITYIEPEHSNSRAIGLDMAFEKNRYAGVRMARDTGKTQVTGPITLVQDAKQTPGFLFFAPFYDFGGTPATTEERRENIIGVTYAPFIMYKLMEGMLASTNRHVSIVITDRGELLYDDASDIGTNAGIDPDPLFEKQVAIDIYGREWLFQIASDLSFRQANANSQPYLILAGGIVIDSMLLLLFLFLTRANRRALSFADLVTEDLRVETRRLEESNQDLERFAYVASHDLKSPINAIDKLVSWIEDDLGDGIPEASKKHLQLLRSRTGRMTSLLDDLLDYSRVSRFDYASEMIRLGEMVEDNDALLDKPDGLSILAEDSELWVPRVPFELVLRNLISNALKHHDRDRGRIEITAEQVGDHYRIRVQDDGPGIPPDLQERAMQMFQTLQSRDKVEGSGMGLAMAKRVVEHYGGELSIESSGRRGTGIVILWPMENPE